MLCRLPFVSNPAPTNFFTASKMIFDLANNLIGSPSWDPSKFCSSYKDNIPDCTTPHNDRPFAPALPLDVNLGKQPPAKTEGYIGNALIMTFDVRDYFSRAKSAIPLTIKIMFRPLAKNEPISREALIQLKKILGEGTPEEFKIFIGWFIDIRASTITLRKKKL